MSLWRNFSSLGVLKKVTENTPELGGTMKKLLIVLWTGAFLASSVSLAFASDWDKAGKALTIIEGLRLFTGGRIDVVGKIGEVATGRTYTNKDGRYGNYTHRRSYGKRHKPYHRLVKRTHCTEEKAWVPEYQWIQKHVPEHTEYHEKYGEVLVEEHYIQVKEEIGGYWDYRETCRDVYTY